MGAFFGGSPQPQDVDQESGELQEACLSCGAFSASSSTRCTSYGVVHQPSLKGPRARASPRSIPEALARVSLSTLRKESMGCPFLKKKKKKKKNVYAARRRTAARSDLLPEVAGEVV